MRRIYTCLLELVDASGRDPRTARALAKRWVGRAYGGWPEHAAAVWRPEPSATVRWRLLDDPERGDDAFVLEWIRPHEHDPTLWRHVTVQVTTAGGDGRILVLEQIESNDAKVRAGPAERVQRPDLVRDLVREIACVDGGWRVLAGPHRVAGERAPDLDAFVRGGRRLPVVLVAPDARGTVRADVPRLCDDLVGLAHVVVLTDQRAAVALDAELGTGRSAPPGGVRLLWPSWRSSDPSTHHPIWREEDVAGAEGPRARVAEAIADLVVSAATLRLEGDPVVERLERSREVIDQRARRADLEALRAAVHEDRAVADELIAEYQTELTRADQRAYELEQALEHEQEERQRFEAFYLTLATRETSAAAPPGRLVDVLRRAKATLIHLVILPESERSAARWQFDRTDKLWEQLVTVDSVAAEWEAGRLGGPFADVCRARGLDWVTGISEVAEQKYAEDYRREYEGRPIMLGPHLRLLGPNQYLRVYCSLDRARHRVVIGHVGGHLRDQSFGG